MYVLLVEIISLSHAEMFKGPVLLGCESEADGPDYVSKELPSHRDESQVQLDVDRSFVYYPEGTSFATTSH